jgi:hypothetical protein
MIGEWYGWTFDVGVGATETLSITSHARADGRHVMRIREVWWKVLGTNNIDITATTAGFTWSIFDGTASAVPNLDDPRLKWIYSWYAQSQDRGGLSIPCTGETVFDLDRPWQCIITPSLTMQMSAEGTSAPVSMDMRVYVDRVNLNEAEAAGMQFAYSAY